MRFWWCSIFSYRPSNANLLLCHDRSVRAAHFAASIGPIMVLFRLSCSSWSTHAKNIFHVYSGSLRRLATALSRFVCVLVWLIMWLIMWSIITHPEPPGLWLTRWLTQPVFDSVARPHAFVIASHVRVERRVASRTTSGGRAGDPNS